MWRSSKRRAASPTPLDPRSRDAETSQSSPRVPRSTHARRSTLSEALRTNPFKSSSSRNVSRDALPALEDPVVGLNRDLKLFACIYPDVKLEVLRELLTRFDGDSRLLISTEQLFRYKNEWARGRLLSPPRDIEDELPRDELFRSQSYKEACHRIIEAEFKSVSRSTIDAVLAEVNQSYTKARPILQEINSKSWRSTIVSLFRRRKPAEDVPAFLVRDSRDGSVRLTISSDDAELDEELATLFVAPINARQKDYQILSDLELAQMLNHDEAEENHALYECQCCYNDVPFERITTCTLEPAHVVCVECVQRALHEALFGQNWTMSVDATRSTLRCMTPSANQCHGHIPYDLVERVITHGPAGHETWHKFNERLSADSLVASGLNLQRCPFCPYAEAADLPTLSAAANISWRFRRPGLSPSTILLMILLEFLLPPLSAFLAVAYLASSARLTEIWYSSLFHLHSSIQPTLFRCRNPSCLRKSCKKCSKAFHVPHACDEPLVLSLRTTVEAARTAALKRTCPRCGTSFVKSSGCNKLVCVCGYAMCYLCRKNIGKVTAANRQPAGENILVEGLRPGIELARDDPVNAGPGLLGGFFGGHRNADADGDQATIDAGEGYRHFCPHFRPVVGQKCTECDKCDLYKTEDEDAIVRRAGENAEREWRQREGLVGSDISREEGRKIRKLEDALVGWSDGGEKSSWEKRAGRAVRNLLRGNWTVQGLMDQFVENWVIIDI